MSLTDLLPAVRNIFADFDRLNIRCYVVALSPVRSMGHLVRHWIIDIGADIPESAVQELIANWSMEYYVSESAMKDAVQRGRSFNLIHLSTSMKVDISVCGSNAFNASVLNRRKLCTTAFGQETISLSMATPEDVILHKLVWYRKVNETSERQLQDVAGVLKQQQERLDQGYIDEWAARLKVQNLWDRIRSENPTRA